MFVEKGPKNHNFSDANKSKKCVEACEFVYRKFKNVSDVGGGYSWIAAE